MMESKRRLVPYEKVEPGFEMIYTGEKVATTDDRIESDEARSVDDDGNVMTKLPYHFAGRGGTDEDNACLNAMQERLGPLDESTRRIRMQIASWEFCDSGFPLVIEELLGAIGTGTLAEPSWRPGCQWNAMAWWDMRPSQPRQTEAMRTIQAILEGYLRGQSIEEPLHAHPCAEGFIRRIYEWLGPSTDLAEYQKLMLERVLLPFEVWAEWSHTWERPDGKHVEPTIPESIHELFEDIFVRENGRGRILDTKISEVIENLTEISDSAKAQLKQVHRRIVEGAPNVCDCNHPTFRRIENWIHGIGRGTLDVSTHQRGAHRRWLDVLVFSYAVALDKWLLGVPMQFLLLDLEHVGLDFTPRSEVLRVYANLGEKTPVKEWLAGSLWLALYADGRRPIFDESLKKAINVREWMDRQLKKGRQQENTPDKK